MAELESARTRIDEIDEQMAVLFEQRLQAVSEVARCKAESGVTVYDSDREDDVVEKNSARLQNPAAAPYYKDFLRHEMSVSRQYQNYVLGRDKVAYQGVEGAFTHIALRHLYPHSTAINFASWDEVFDAVSSGEAAYGVLPFENSHAGDVSAVLDLCFEHREINVLDVYDLPISQNLLVLPGTTLKQIRSVVSHPQAISQSEQFLKANNLPAKAFPNTAIAAKYVAETGDPTIAAIASSETAEIYGLEVLVQNINTDGDNTTRFIVIGKDQPAGGDHFNLLFTVDNRPGTLGAVIQLIGEAGFNMESIKSRPRPGEKFQYYFYAEIVGHPDSPEGQKLLERLSWNCQTVRLLGAFHRG